MTVALAISILMGFDMMILSANWTTNFLPCIDHDLKLILVWAISTIVIYFVIKKALLYLFKENDNGN